MAAVSPLAHDEVRIRYASLEALAHPHVLAQALTFLGRDERTRFERYSGDDDRRMFLLGRVLARLLVGDALGVLPTAWAWREGAHGRPEIASPPTPLRFNLSHSAGLVVCALALGRDVGVDVEDLSRRPVERAVVHRYCSADEIRDIDAQADRWHDRFLRYWTLKEAYLKARGLGISVTLADLGFSSDPAPRVLFARSLAGADDRWYFHLAQPTERHLLAVAAAAPDGNDPVISIERLDPSTRPPFNGPAA